MVLLFTEKKIYQKELMIIMKQIKKINLKSQVRAELEEYIHSLDLDVANKLPREEELCRILGISRVRFEACWMIWQQRELSSGFMEEVLLSIRTFGKLHAGLTRQSIFRI